MKYKSSKLLYDKISMTTKQSLFIDEECDIWSKAL